MNGVIMEDKEKSQLIELYQKSDGYKKIYKNVQKKAEVLKGIILQTIDKEVVHDHDDLIHVEYDTAIETMKMFDSPDQGCELMKDKIKEMYIDKIEMQIWSSLPPDNYKKQYTANDLNKHRTNVMLHILFNLDNLVSTMVAPQEANDDPYEK